VLFQYNPEVPLPTKLSPKYLGPYEVIRHTKNDVQCRHLVDGFVKVFHVTRLKIFHGSREDAYAMAMLDKNQSLVDTILAYRGDPSTRTTTEFEVKFADGDVVWLPYSKDLSNSVPFEDFCRSRAELWPLIYTVAIAQSMIKQLNCQPIVDVQPGTIVYIHLRSFGPTWYDSLPLPDLHHLDYLLIGHYKDFKNRLRTKISLFIPLTQETYVVNHFYVKTWAFATQVPPDRPYTILTRRFALQYPSILPDSTRDTLLRQFQAHPDLD
jgi:hypothetical protein